MKRSSMEVTVGMIVDAAGLIQEFEHCRTTGESFHLSITNEPYMRLVIEVVGKEQVSVAHYYTQNGDAMRDPEIVFGVRWLPIEITQDPVGIYRRSDPGYYLRGVVGLAHMWAMNIRYQGFAHGMMRSSTHTIKQLAKAA